MDVRSSLHWFLKRTLRNLSQVIICSVLLIGAAPLLAQSQSTLPFEVQNPNKKRWYPVEAVRIYKSACDLVARTVRPDRPPQLEPKFRLVLGTESDQFVRNDGVNEIHLKSWDAETFAEGVALIAVREVVHADDIAKLAHQSVVLANSTLDVRELQGR